MNMLSINITLKKSSAYTDSRLINVRIFSEWLPCSFTTPNFGEEENIPWKENEDGLMSSTFITNVDCDISNPEKMQLFNEKPGIYAVVLGDNAPFGFSFVDCSSFAIEAGTSSARHSQLGDYELNISVSIDKPLLSLTDVIPLEPLVLDIKSVSAYPVLGNESLEEAVKSSYLYGEFNLGGGIKRQILGFPYVTYETPTTTTIDETTTLNNTNTIEKTEKMNINMKICLLPGLINIPKLKDSLISSTLTLELHNENIFTRAFHQRNITEYLELLNQSQSVEIPVEVPKKGSKPAATAPGKKDLIPVENNIIPKVIVTEMLETDKFLLNCIHRSLTVSRCIRPHGIIRYRLEQLLSSSKDLLNKFARMRNNGLPLPGDDTVIVQEDMLVEVRLEKPSKPEKWELPADMSLKSALQRAKLETQSRLDGTLAGTNSSTLPSISRAAAGRSQMVSSMLTKPTPRHELFLVNNTAVEITAALHRSLLAPKSAGSTSTTPGKHPSPSPSSPALSPGKTTPPLPPLSDRELTEKLLITPFTRMIVLFKYQNDEILRAIGKGLEAINSAALPDIQGTLRSYSFTEEEIHASKEARLDVITGFMIIDDDMRLVVLEGLAAPNKGMSKMFTEYLPKIQQNNESLKILCNPEVLFPDRLYPEFGPDIRRIRIRDKLKKLARRPEVYNRKQVEELCFQGIDSIMTIKRAQDMISTKKLNMYPTAESLNKLELLYGEAITRADMDGTLRDQFMENYERQQKQQQQRVETPKTQNISNQGESLLNTNNNNNNNITSTGRVNREIYQPTDCRNPAFELHLQTRPVHRINYMEETRSLRQLAWEEMLKRREKREETYETNLRTVLGEAAYKQAMVSGDGPKIYLYSQQKLNFKEKAFDLLRHRISEDKNATYTYSKDFVSQTICIVDEEKLEKNEKIKSQSEWLTQRGFQYPKPKTSKELLTHPQRPSDSRIEDLKEPFRDILDVPISAGSTADPTLRELEKGFKTQIPTNGLFGSLKPVTFEREFELKLVGNREKLPRGGLTGGTEIDPHAFRSVHLGGDNQARIIAEAAEKEKKDWNDKVIVDNLTIKVGGFKIRDKPLQVNRTQDILHDEPKRKELINLRHRTSHLGEDWSYAPAPLSILNAEPFVSNQAATALLRTTNPDKFITSGKLVMASSATRNNNNNSSNNALLRNSSFASEESDSTSNNGDEDNHHSAQYRGSSSKPLDFTRYIHKDTFNPKLMSAIARRKHPPQDRNSAECTGPKWDAAAAASTHK